MKITYGMSSEFHEMSLTQKHSKKQQSCGVITILLAEKSTEKTKVRVPSLFHWQDLLNQL